MRDNWKRRIDRANELGRADPRGTALMTQYAALLSAQATCYEALVRRGGRLTGSIDRDLAELRGPAAAAFGTIRSSMPAQVAGAAPQDEAAIDDLLRAGWRESSIPFVARIVLQPYAEALAALASSISPAYACRPNGRDLQPTPGRATCPFCGGPPQVSVLRQDSSAEGGSRAVICSTCSTDWQVRRILCTACGEEDERRLHYFRAPEFEHMRVDACETCRHYLKAVDLTRLGLAVPVVDEVASAALDLWAAEHDYTKLTLNLIGL